MLTVNRVEVTGWDVAMRGMRNSWNSWSKSTPEADLELARKLIKAGPSHSKFMRMIHISCDVTAPLYWWKEFDTYKVGTVANSTSTMHTLSHTPITAEMFEFDSPHDDVIAMLEGIRLEYVTTQNKDIWRQLIQLLPCAFKQLRTVDLNAEVLRNIIQQRTGHKLVEWNEFINNITASLPIYLQELVQHG